MGFAAEVKGLVPLETNPGLLFPQGLPKFPFSLRDLFKIPFFWPKQSKFPAPPSLQHLHRTAQGALKTGKNLWDKALDQGRHPEAAQKSRIGKGWEPDPCGICGIFIKARRDFLLRSQKKRGKFVSEGEIGEEEENSGFQSLFFPRFWEVSGSLGEFSASLKDGE